MMSRGLGLGEFRGLGHIWCAANRRAARYKCALRGEARRFEREETGSTTILTLFIFIAMLVMAGLGVDMMRYEMERTHLQATLDNAVLAGAGAPLGSQVADVEEIVLDYFAKASMSDYLHDIDTDGEGEDDIVTSLNATRVYAEASMTMDTYLMHLSGVSELSAFGAAQAEVATPKLEVSLVLDVSGSMGGTKLSNLKTAANSFVTTILGQSEPGDTVISVVPFAWTVTPTEEMFEALTVNETHDYSTCIRFDGSDYSTPAIDPDVAVEQQIYTSIYGSDFDSLNTSWRSCYTEGRAQILPYSMSETALHAHINSLHADGNTSAHIGMKWGAAMLDPEFQSVVQSLQAATVVDNSFTNLPALYNEAETLKVIVLMADGQNTSSYYFSDNSDYRGPNSHLKQLTWAEMEFSYAWRQNNRGEIRYSNNENRCTRAQWTCVYEATGEEYSAYYLYDENDDRYLDVEQSGPFDADENNNGLVWIDADEYEDFQDDPQFISSEALSWEEAWGFMSPEYYGDTTGDWGAWNDYVGNSEYGSLKDTRMQAICSAAKAQSVVVYTIGYSISSGGNAETQLQNCASTGNHYYPTNGSNISAAFSSIASNVKNLRLTQ